MRQYYTNFIKLLAKRIKQQAEHKIATKLVSV
jgi:hypothetical protein